MNRIAPPNKHRPLIKSNDPAREKKWIGWFRPLERGWRQESLTAVPIEILKDSKVTRTRLVISIPRACGGAVERNRFRRIIRAYFQPLLEERPKKALWIRMTNRHKLGRKILLNDYKKILDSLAQKLWL